MLVWQRYWWSAAPKEGPGLLKYGYSKYGHLGPFLAQGCCAASQGLMPAI